MRGVLTEWIQGFYDGIKEYEGSRGLWHLQNLLEFRLRQARLPPPRSLSNLQLLDVIDALLRWRIAPASRSIDAMADLLISGGAGWRVNVARNGLERRVDPTVTAAAAETIRSACDEAADHLARAWTGAYGRDPDPDKAYDEAVLAVEAVACPLVCPTNTRRTLGTVIRDLRNQAAQWELVIGDSTGQPGGPRSLVEMLALLWEGQSRHAGASNSRQQTQAEGQAAVHLAATLVQWLASGVLRHR